ncbi:tRNA (adenosine(37)-N6)-threonylcarbamoyltransferase complex ATPase subunit type 1 TsaE [Halalkalibacterium halodurans]|uniref:tRNA (adenosine(37)-N6)-threonylcarbamoyltransferase complex ATPase subunit type 1 TsaE n=1 Tax=Halalkalibacterium halodurans TaxID=86665 RepID=UPI002E1D94CA|nr:tRNA (adenosine(37)-N6)-threonylcarbamoyltransferase complex ATPase subunit type 1 TsaE [Halalkalibacterium halodurans]MED3645455.1 tRNA (adenosine(37)-N6)-threonylcarbamoyltransferase complex ATPase subunit type 1 TsaE [Halalkalibacterium halodurans]
MKRLMMITQSPEATMAFAQKLADKLLAGDVITLEGDLGAGKTSFTKGLALGLGIKRVVKSPTFTIIREYKGRLPLYHMDVYRLNEEEEDLGFDEYFHGDGVTVVEWASLIEGRLPPVRLAITITHAGESERQLSFTAYGERWEEVLKELLDHEDVSD